MNSVVLIVRLTRDPEVRYTEAQLAIARFSLAVDRQRYGNREDGNTADFINIVVFGKQAENVERYLVKGRLVGVQGRIQTGSYVNKDGNKVYTTDVIADRVEFLEWGDRRTTETGGNTSNDGIPNGFEALEDEEIPF